ncbi:MAG: TetR/AcrR family transcriptional regulator [Pseudomonadota bacterium]
MGRRNDHTREQLRALTLDAASQLVASHGLKGLSARRIAEEIGYSAGSLYVVFANLDDIVVHVNAATLAELHDAIAHIPVAEPDPAQAMQALAKTYLQFAIANANRWRCIFDHRLPESVDLPDWYLAQVGRMFAVVAEPIARLRPDLDAAGLQRAARALWSAVHGVCILGLDDKLDLSRDIQVDDVLETLVRTVMAGATEL